MGGNRVTISGLIGTCAIQAISVRDLLLTPKQAAARPLIGTIISYRSIDLLERVEAKTKDILDGCVADFSRLRAGKMAPSRKCVRQILRAELSRHIRDDLRVHGIGSSRRNTKSGKLSSRSTVVSRDELFKAVFDAHKAMELNPFHADDDRHAWTVISKNSAVTMESFWVCVRAVAELRQVIERMKSNLVGQNFHDFRTHQHFGGLMSSAASHGP
jgi:hypothetical protein